MKKSFWEKCFSTSGEWLGPPVEEQKVIDAFNTNHILGSIFHIYDKVVPYPYSPNIDTARVIVLASNPGYETCGGEFEFPCEWGENRREVCEFHCGNYDYLSSDTGKGILESTYKNLVERKGENIYEGYWKKKMSPLYDAVGGDEHQVNQKVALVEFFPYHSIKFKKISKYYFKKVGVDGDYLPSQTHSFNLIKRRVDEGVIIICTRGEKVWREALESVGCKLSPENFYVTNSYLNTVLSENNLSKSGSWPKIVKKIQE